MQEIIYKNRKVLSIAFTLAFTFACIGNFVYAESFEDRLEYEVYEESLGKIVVSLLLGIVVAVNVLPIIFNQTNTLESNADLDTNEQSLVSTWNILIIVGVMMAIIGIVM